MSESEEEWITVRRRRGARSGVSKKLQKLAIPVVPLAFDALAEPEERTDQEPSKSKKKKKSKKAKAEDQDDNDDQRADAPTQKGPTSISSGKQTPAGAGKAPGPAVQRSFFAWLLSQLIAVLVLLGLMRAPGASKKKRKSKAAAKASAPEATAADAASHVPVSKPAAAPQVQAPAAATAPKPPAGTAKAAGAAATPAPPASKDKAAAAASSTSAKPTGKAPAASAAVAAASGVKKPDAAAAPPAVAAKEPPAAAAKPAAAATASSSGKPVAPATSAATASPPPAAKAAPAADDASSAGKAAPAAAAAVKCDADWGRGKFVVQSLPTAHADVVAAVALAGDLAVSAGYDGAVKLWHWPVPGSPGGAVATRPALSRTLVGHSGRVEALAADAASRRLASSGRDSTLKVWDLGSEAAGSDSRELASTYVYESVRALAADWAGEGGAAAGRVLLGARSGTVLLYSLGAGGAGRKVAALRGHEDEVTALGFLGGSLAVSGSRDGTVRLWDLRAADKGSAGAAVLNGLSGRVCSVSSVGEHHLVVGDCSSSLKLWDLRALQLPPKASRSAPPSPPPRRVANAPGFAGDTCPVAGLWHAPKSGVLVSSCIAWWTANKQALEEAPPTAKLPMACLNVSAVGPPAASAAAADSTTDLLCQYQYTLRLGPGVVTCMAGAANEAGMLVGGATGALWALRLVRGGSAAGAAAERAAQAVGSEAASGGGDGGCEVVDALVVGAEEYSDDEYDDGDEEGDEEEDQE